MMKRTTMKNKILFVILLTCLTIPSLASAFGIIQNTTALDINPRIEQGTVVYINDTIDISGVVPPYPYLAYWDGYDLYDTNATYIIDLPTESSAYYNFTIDPAIFSNRLGKWYKYDGTFEQSANNIAFIVEPQILKNSTMRYENGTLINLSVSVASNTSMLNQVLPPAPPVPPKKISDYLVARGDSWNMTFNQTTNIWLFGNTDMLMDVESVNNTVDISNDILQDFQPGDYKLIVQTMGNGTNDFTVKYNPADTSIKWFDPKLFAVHSENVYGYSPEVTMEKFKEIMPESYDNFTIYDFTLQDPSMEIVSVAESMDTFNETVDEAGVTHYNTNASFVDVKGYTNIAPGDPLTFWMDENKTAKNYLGTKKDLNVITLNASGNYGGYERWFEAFIPFNKYNTALGVHTITGYAGDSTSGTNAMFTLYDAPPNSYVPSQEVRYVAGANGPVEFNPTPTPVIQTVTVVQTIKVVQTVTVPVTPSPEVVHAQQQKALDETISTWATRIFVMIIVIGVLVWGISLYLRKREGEE
jgi:hypothetical protein